MGSESSNSGLSTTDLTDDILDADLILRRKDDLTVVILSYLTYGSPLYRYCTIPAPDLLVKRIRYYVLVLFNPVLSGTGSGAYRQHYDLAPVQ
jgi:hypothetical protein